MATTSISAKFEPAVLKAYQKNEATMFLSLNNSDATKTFWCECDISVTSPLSLAHDKELGMGRTRIGILKPNRSIEKQIKLYTRPNSFPDTYKLNIVAYLYDEDGAIAERVEQNENIRCDG